MALTKKQHMAAWDAGYEGISACVNGVGADNLSTLQDAFSECVHGDERVMFDERGVSFSDDDEIEAQQAAMAGIRAYWSDRPDLVETPLFSGRDETWYWVTEEGLHGGSGFSTEVEAEDDIDYYLDSE